MPSAAMHWDRMFSGRRHVVTPSNAPQHEERVSPATLGDAPLGVKEAGFGRLEPMTSARSVRTATALDACAVAELLHQVNREYDTPTPGPAVLAARLEHLLSGGDVVALLAGEPAVGLALLTLRPNVWWTGPVALLDELYVVPAERGGAVGTALLKACEQECRRHGSHLLEINVDGDDAGARRFYERHGYINREPGQTEPQLLYHRALDSLG